MCQPGQPDPLAVPHGTPPRAGLNVPGGEPGGSRPSTLPRQKQSATPNTMADYARRIKQLEDKLQAKEDERRSRGRAGASPPAAGSHSNSAARAATGHHAHEARHDDLHAGAIPAPLGDGHRAPPTDPTAGAATHVKVDYEGDHAQGHHLDAGRVPDQQAVTDRHAAARAPDHNRGAQDDRTPHAVPPLRIGCPARCDVTPASERNYHAPWSHNTLPWERTTVIIIIPHEQRSSPTAACRPILSVALVRERRGRTYPSWSTCVAYLTWP